MKKYRLSTAIGLAMIICAFMGYGSLYILPFELAGLSESDSYEVGGFFLFQVFLYSLLFLAGLTTIVSGYLFSLLKRGKSEQEQNVIIVLLQWIALFIFVFLAILQLGAAAMQIYFKVFPT